MTSRFKRDGQEVGRSEEDICVSHNERVRRAVQRESRRLPIADLVPYEPSIIRRTVDDHLKALAQGDKLRSPRAVEVEGRFLIVDGNNQIRARFERGDTEIDILITVADSSCHDDYSRTMAKRLRDGTTFASLPEDPTDDARKQRTLQEFKSMMDEMQIRALQDDSETRSGPGDEPEDDDAWYK